MKRYEHMVLYHLINQSTWSGAGSVVMESIRSRINRITGFDGIGDGINCSSACAGPRKAMKLLLGLFHGGEPISPEPTPIFHPPPPPSNEVSAVIWALETSTDPIMSCINGRVVCEGMAERATSCIKAFGVLETVTEKPQHTFDLWTFKGTVIQNATDDLQAMIWFFRLGRSGSSPHIISQIIPKNVLGLLNLHDTSLRDVSFLTDFLFCVNSFFSPMVARDRSVLDKSPTHNNLIENLAEYLDHDALGITKSWMTFSPMLPNFHQCCEWTTILGRTIDVGMPHIGSTTSVLRLVRVWDAERLDLQSETQDVEWVYRTLESLHNLESLAYDLIRDLLQVLSFCPQSYGTPSAAALRMILSSFPEAVSAAPRGDPARSQIQRLALRVLCRADHWFSDDELGLVLAEESVWPSLAGSGLPHYTLLGEKLAKTPGWKSIISQDLPGWFDQDYSTMGREQAKSFLAVISLVWDVDETVADQFGGEKKGVMMFVALANTWDRIDFSSPQVHHRCIRKFAKCTVSTAFSARINDRAVTPSRKVVRPSQNFKETIMGGLGDAVARAGVRARLETDSGGRNGVAEFLSRFALMINGELRNSQQREANQYDYWDALRKTWMTEVESLPEAFGIAR
ncbi:hypothetical protein B0H13DRAFT_1888180 [Mycena leptocephala]|nr:hypothetical protein B0H13DRAFT_1888180 [Mycena leptocephala]